MSTNKKIESIVKAEALKAEAKRKGVQPIKPEDVKVADFNGASVRKWAEAVRSSGENTLPKIYRFVSSLPVRSQDGKRVIVEGKYELGCYYKGKPMTLARFIAGYGFKLPTKGTMKRCDELIAEYKDALAQRGKYAPKTAKASKAK